MEGGQEPEPEPGPEQGCLQGQLWNSVWAHRLQKVKKYIPAYECKEKQTGLEPESCPGHLAAKRATQRGKQPTLPRVRMSLLMTPPFPLCSFQVSYA